MNLKVAIERFMNDYSSGIDTKQSNWPERRISMETEIWRIAQLAMEMQHEVCSKSTKYR